MRSGDPKVGREDDYYRSEFERIVDKRFEQVRFHSLPALVSTKREQGYRMWRPYEGGEYERKDFELVEGMWDHEHCSLCDFKIRDGHTYWKNQGRITLLCDECYDCFIRS